ncbi:hypothetical protein ACHAXT_002414 [Thalassiosira profunda]
MTTALPTTARKRRRPAPGALLLAATALAGEGASASRGAERQSERNLRRPPHPHEAAKQPRRTAKGAEGEAGPRSIHRSQQLHHLRHLDRRRGLERDSTGKTRAANRKKGGGGAFNPNLQAYDPHNTDYVHNNPALGSFSNGKVKNDGAGPGLGGASGDGDSGGGGEGGEGATEAISRGKAGKVPDAAANSNSAPWSPCPPDPTFAGSRASFDCLSYITCANGRPQGSYSSCMGLKFDNVRGVCDWAANVRCEDPTQSNGGGSNGDSGRNDSGGSSSGGGSSKPIGSATAIEVHTSDRAGSSGATASDGEVTGWNGGSDWGGAWIDGVWVSDGDPSSAPDAEPATVRWDAVTSYPPREVLPLHAPNYPAGGSAAIPSDYTSPEGWSAFSRSKPENGPGKTVIGYYAAWQFYDHDERARAANMEFSKVDRVNFAFFQTDAAGHIWGTDSWADAISLFGPHDWSVDVPAHAGHAPQFHDDNGFAPDDPAHPDAFVYVGAKYVDLGDSVYCHRATPTGRRDCNGHSHAEGVIGRAHKQGAEVYPSLGGFSLSEPFVKLAADANARRTFAKNCVGLIREYDFDGIDIDWEFPTYEPHGGTPADKANFVLLLRDIRAALDAYASATYPNGDRTFGLTAALPCGPPLIDGIDVPGVAQHLSEFNLMSYDFHGTWDELVGVNAPLHDQPADQFESVGYSVDGCVQRYLAEGAQASQINTGLAFYGRSYGGADALYVEHDGGPDSKNWWADGGQPQYYTLEGRLGEMISLRDDATSTQYAYFENGDGVVSYDNRQSICDKVEYTRAGDYHGFIIWELSGDLTEDLRTPLLDAVNFKLEQGDGFDCELFRMETRDESGAVVGVQAAEPNKYYANWEIQTCVNDGKEPAWTLDEDLFRFKKECCMEKFEHDFDDCTGPPTLSPTLGPSTDPTVSPTTDQPTHVFGAAQVSYADDPASSAADAASTGGPAPPDTRCFGGCKNAGEKCVGNQNHPQQIDDETCKDCQSGQTFWPCDVDGLCFCWDPDTPRIPPAPSSGLAQLSTERPCDFFTQAMYDSLAPDAEHPYTYQGLCDAIDNYNAGHIEKIFMMGTEFQRLSEFASFIGHTLHESDEWRASREYLMCADHQVVGSETFCKPCDSGSFNWETFTCDGVGLAGGGLTFNGYCDHTIEPPGACPCDDMLESEPAPLEGYIPASKVFFGRGAIQLSWNYNYRAASEALTGDATTFCDNPDLVATTPEFAWGAGVFFWMENLKEETTCHIEALKHGDFGGTLNNINGGLECPAYHGGWHGEAIKLRLNRYCKASSVLGLESILIFEGCKGLNNSFAECLGDGTCPDCAQYDDGTSVYIAHDPGTEPVPSTPDDPVIVTLPTLEAAEPVANGQTDPMPEPAYLGDGACDPDSPMNTPECDFDGGDCCRETCDLDSTYGCSAESFGYGPFGYFCLNPSLDEYIDPSICTVSDRTRIGDGRCDDGVEVYNSEACNWDGGDCCQETCDQTYAHFQCGDPEFPYACRGVSATAAPTSSPTANPTQPPTPLPVEASDAPEPGVGEDSSTGFAGSIGDAFASSDNQPNPMTPTPMPTPGPTPEPSPHPTLVPVETTTSTTTTSTESASLAGPGLYTLTPSDDATMVFDHPDDNFGSEDSLLVDDDSGVYDALLRFDLSSIHVSGGTSVASATLRLYCTDGSDSGGIVGRTANENWNEDTVTWNNAPTGVGAPLASLGRVTKGNWYDVDITSLFSNGVASAETVRITSNSWNRAGYSSKEGSNSPQLVIQLEEAASFAHSFGAAQSQPAATDTDMCAEDMRECHDGSLVSRVPEDGCNFAPCPPASIESYGAQGTGLFFPIWGTEGGAACIDASSPPPYAKGEYMKDSKSDCCQSFFALDFDECLAS